jgi:predicted RNA-binding Zn ribbon-like protein
MRQAGSTEILVAGPAGGGARMREWLAMKLAGTIVHDGSGGVRGDLTTPAGLAAWLRAEAALLESQTGTRAFAADERLRTEVVAVRTAVRALFARMVSPAPPSRADAGQLPDPVAALAQLNRAAGQLPVTVALDWPTDGSPRVLMAAADGGADPAALLTSALARDAIAFLADPDSRLLAACSAPRCVRYFLREHGRQEYCKPSCSNRARAARHYKRRISAT